LERIEVKSMTTSYSRKKLARKGSEEARSRMLTLISGQKGPLPLDNDQRIQQESAERTSDEMRSWVREKTSGPYLSGVKERVMDRHPGLTEEDLDHMLAAT
jgi:hypothetical protein